MPPKDTPAPVTGHAPKNRARAKDIAPEVARLHGEGVGRNEIARQLDVSAGLVTKAAQLAGVTFDGSLTRQATAVVVLNAKELRARLSEQLLVESGEQLAMVRRLRESGPDNLAEGKMLASAWREVTVAAGVAIDKSMKLESVTDHDLSAVDQFMAAMLGEKAADDEVPELDEYGRVIYDD